MSPIEILLAVGIPLTLAVLAWEHVVSPIRARRRIVREIRDSSWHGPRH